MQSEEGLLTFDVNRTHYVDALEKAYGVSLRSLTKAEFLQFAHGICLGDIPNAEKPDRVDQSYVFLLMSEAPFVPQELLELCAATIRRRFERLELLSDSDDYWDDFWITERAIESLGGIDHPGVLEELAWVIDYCLERQYFASWYPTDTRNMKACPRQFGGFLSTATRALARFAQKHDARQHSFDLGRILNWRSHLAGFPGATDSVADLDLALQGLATRPLVNPTTR